MELLFRLCQILTENPTVEVESASKGKIKMTAREMLITALGLTGKGAKTATSSKEIKDLHDKVENLENEIKKIKEWGKEVDNTLDDLVPEDDGEKAEVSEPATETTKPKTKKEKPKNPPAGKKTPPSDF